MLQRWTHEQQVNRKEYIFRSNRMNQHLTASSLRNTLRKINGIIGEQLGLDSLRVSPHTFRHTFSRNWIVGGGDAFSLRIIMGHSSMRTTEKYVYLWGTDLVSAHDRVSPAKGVKFDL